MIDADAPIGRFLRRVADMLAKGQTATRAQADVIMRVSDDPRPVLQQLAQSLRFLAEELNGAADRAEELAKAWPSEPPR